jgi:hypothetical protein
MIFALLAVGGAAHAHHSSAPHYDANRPIRIEGTVAEFEFVNPHTFLHVSVIDDGGGSVVWHCELPAAVMLRRQGWSPDKFTPGQPVTVSGIAARRDVHGCALRSVVLADGTEVGLQGEILTKSGEAQESPESDFAPALEKGDQLIEGVWVRDMQRRPNGPAAGPGPGDRAPPGSETFTEAGLQAQARYDQRFDDPSFSCSASSIVRAWSGPGTPTAIQIDNGVLTIRHEFMDTVRTVDISTREHSQDLAPTVFGHSVGWFEGQTLVIDTIGYSAGVFSPHPGILHSDALHTVERLTADSERTTLSVAWTADDPKYFKRPLSGEFLYKPSQYEVQRFGCTVEHANR